MAMMEQVGMNAVAGETPAVLVEVKEPPEAPSRKMEVLYKVDEQKLRAIFPEETWVLILNQMDPEDQENCANASPYFWELLQKQRNVFLFPKVFEIMALKLEQYYEVCKVTKVEGVGGGKQEPVAMRTEMDARKWKSAVLNCRLACSTWNKAVENCYQSPAMNGIHELVNDLDPRSKLNNVHHIRWDRLEYVGAGQLHDQFLEHFEESHHSGTKAPPKNPLLGRHLRISARPALTECNGVTKILEKFGKEIWYLELIVGIPKPSLNFRHYKKLASWLDLVPNLKYLKISRMFPNSKVATENGKIAGLIKRNPLPKLEKLEVLHLEDLGTAIGGELVRKNCHVTHLKIWDTDIADEDIENSVELPNLQAFSALNTRSGDKMLEKLGPTWKNLKKLYYGHKTQYPNDQWAGIGASQLFKILETNWAATLTDLHLEHPFGFEEKAMLQQSKKLRLNLSAVRRLMLCLFGPVFLDFALPLKNSLEHLEIQLMYDHRRFSNKYMKRVKNEQEIEVAGFEDEMHKSNIWEYFGKLKTVKLVYSGYRGCDFELFTNEKEKFSYSQKGMELN